jgi:hypothetical protein
MEEPPFCLTLFSDDFQLPSNYPTDALPTTFQRGVLAHTPNTPCALGARTHQLECASCFHAVGEGRKSGLKSLGEHGKALCR